MEIKSTRRFFRTQFVIENKLSFSTIVLLQDIYSWLLGNNPPKALIFKGVSYYFISQTHFYNLNYGLLSQQRVNQIFKELKDVGIIESNVIVDNHKNYVSFNWNKIKESILDEQELKEMENNNWWQKIHDYANQQIEQEKNYSQDNSDEEYDIVVKNNRNYLVKKERKSYNKDREENMAGLLDDEDMQKKAYCCKQADAIAKRILKKYGTVFTTKYPLDGQEPTKTYIRICTKITDIYNGHFISSRFYDFDENVFKNRQFDTEGWREKLQEARGDWAKVKKLIFDAIENFLLMFDENRMPMKKDYLTNNLNDWFFSDNPNNKGQSQFIQSLNEPMYVKQKLGLDKAKGIVEEMKEKSPVSYLAGHELNELLPENANEASAWTFIQSIIRWGKLLYQYDNNAKYFLQCKIGNDLESGPKVLPALFARYLKENNIGVSLNTLNIEQAIDSNAPWCWFIQDACSKHNINSNVVRCLDEDDFYDAYKDKKISFDDMEEVVS